MARRDEIEYEKKYLLYKSKCEEVSGNIMADIVDNTVVYNDFEYDQLPKEDGVAPLTADAVWAR